jgi:hypothetical protein
MKLPIRTLGLIAAGLLVGTALSPVAAQQSGVDGQVALRSDGALYLIQNGQRRWISTATLADSDINAIPEGDPIMTGLALAGSADAQAKPSAAPPASSASPATGAAPAAAAAPAAGAAPTAKPTAASSSSGPTATKPSEESGETLSADLPIEVDLDGEDRIDQGDERKVEIKTKKDFTCELLLRLPDGTDKTEDSKNADSSGHCRYTIEVPDNAKEGGGWLVGTVRDGGKVNRQEIAVTIIKKK